MAIITGVSVTDQRHLVVTLNVGLAPVSYANGARWILAEPVGALQCDVLSATPRAINDAVVDMIVGPALTPGKTYTLAPATGLQGITNTLAFAVPGDSTLPHEDWTDEWPHPILDALTESVGEAIQELAGVPQTRLLRDLSYPDPYLDGAVAFVESTIAFENGSTFYAGDTVWTYQSVTNNALRGCVPAEDKGKTIPAGTFVELDARTVPPSE